MFWNLYLFPAQNEKVNNFNSLEIYAKKLVCSAEQK